jgi:hypothetical protein
MLKMRSAYSFSVQLLCYPSSLGWIERDFYLELRVAWGLQKLGFGPSKPIPKYFCIWFRLTFVAKPSKVSQSVRKCEGF